MCSSVHLFGNSPTCNINKIIPPHSKTAAIGAGISFLKRQSVDFWFVRAAQYSKNSNCLANTVIVLSSNEDSVVNNIVSISDKTVERFLASYDLSIVPSLGLFAVLWLKVKFENIYISGITLDITDANINGYFWNATERRVNSYHNLLAECLFLSKMIKQQTLYEF